MNDLAGHNAVVVLQRRKIHFKFSFSFRVGRKMKLSTKPVEASIEKQERMRSQGL